MSANQLQEAVTLIKSGNQQKGQQLLAELLHQDPGNENAWLWMSTIVSADERRLCLEKVLSINPGNLQAQKFLAQLKATETASHPSVQTVPSPAQGPVKSMVPSNSSVAYPNSAIASQPVYSLTPTFEPKQLEPIPEPVPLDQPISTYDALATSKPQIWVTPDKYMTGLVCISGNTLLACEIVATSTNKALALADRIMQGTSPKQIYDERESLNLSDAHCLPINRVVSALYFSAPMKVTWVEPSGKQNTIRVACGKQNYKEIIDALHQRLGARYHVIERPISRGRVLGSSLIPLLIVSAITVFVYMLALDFSTGGHATGSARVSSIAFFILLLFPTGVPCIVVPILILLIITTISSLAKPPTEIALLHHTLIEKEV